jgi:transcriptional regulator with XRE-family HTH domain
MMREPLSQYVKRVMQQKGLGVRDVERNSKNKITNSHISKILAGTAHNLTAEKIVALAAGLQVNPHEVFSVIAGCSPGPEPPDLMLFADVIQKLAMNPLLLEVLQELLSFEEKDYADMLTAFRFMKGRNQKVQKRKKKKG